MSRILEDAKRRIEQVRKRGAEVTVQSGGKPVENAVVRFRMKNHQFLFGAVCYKYGTYDKPEMNELFSREFTKLCNYTMVPYHWRWYEPEKGNYNEPYTSGLIRWADANNIKKKLHALIWHELCPEWVSFGDDMKALYTQRITHLMQNYGNEFDFIDVANETTVNDRFDNPVSRWVKSYGPMNMLKFGTELVRSFKPRAKLLYGDWNVHVDAYYDFLRQMRDNGIDIDILGIQSHQHIDRWSEEETMRILELASSYGWPIHFPECSVCSGTPIGETDFSADAVNLWNETEEDLYSQAEFAKDFYTLVFSHPSTEALSWFDFTDHRWLSAPAGLVTDDLKTKPVYDTLYDLIHREWHSDAELATGTDGKCAVRLFCGSYNIEVEADGKKIAINKDILRESFYAGGGEAERIVVDI